MAGILNAQNNIAASFPALDQFGPNTTLLLHGDGTNGAQNNTFLDSSANNFTITRNGNTTQGTFSPFSQPNGWWSNYFNQSGYLYNTSTSAGSFGTGNFTVECWIYITGGDGSGRCIYDTRATGSGAGTFMSIDTSNNLVFYCNSTIYFTYSQPPKNQWIHVAVCRTGTGANQLTMYINGSSIGTNTLSTNISSTYCVVGAVGDSPLGVAPFLGYISNFRIVKGTAVYTSNFTPLISPLTAITNTTLLTCQSNRFVDNSASPVTLTVSGTPAVQAFHPISAPTSYFPSVNGGGAYFDGSGDYLNAGSNAAFAFGTGAYTVEMWVYPFSISQQIYMINDSTGGSGFYFETNSSAGFSIIPRGGGSGLTGGYSSLIINSWNHIVFCRASTSSNQTSIFVNGARVANGTDSNNWTVTGPCSIGGFSPGSYMLNGHMSQVRLVKGTDVYGYNNTTITIPTAPLAAIANTSLLLSCTNGGIFDSVSQNALETVGNAQVSTTQSKFGGASMYFDGSASYVSFINNPINVLGDFTVEGWFYSATATSAFQAILGFGGNPSLNSLSSIAFFLGNDSGGAGAGSSVRLLCSTNGSSWALDSTSPSGITSNSTWYHFSIVRNGGTFTVYINGNAVITSTSIAATTSLYAGTVNRVGSYAYNSFYLSGYLDDLRVTKGIARYTQNFTPPQNAFPNFGPLTNIPTVDPNFNNTTLLLHGNGTNGAQNNTFLDSSTNNFTITRNGNTTQGTFTPFSQPNGWWSNYFDGDGDQLTAPVAAISGIGSSNFSFECWVYALRQTNTFAQGLISYGPAGVTSTSSCISFQLTSSGYLASTYAAGDSILLTDPVLFPINQWTHCVVCRSGSTISLFKNGVRVATSSTSATVGSGGDTLAIGGQWFANASTRQLQGYISNARIVNGASAYDATQTTITVPTLALTAISSTSLLTCQSNRFIDNSSNGYAITVAGTPSTQNFYPFFPPLDYSTAAIGGSGYFDGSGDYLSLAGSSAFAIATSTTPFTVEAWVYMTSIYTAAPNPIWTERYNADGDTVSLAVCFTDGTGIGTNVGGVYPAFGYYTGSGWVTAAVSTTGIALNTWNHIAVVFTGSTSKIFLNGVDVTKSSSPTPATTWGATGINGQAWYVGAAWATNFTFTGYISNLRFVNGTAVYTSAFTPPTAPLSAVTNTALLVSATNAGIFDNASKNTFETVSNAQISTTQSKFGGSSMYFDTSGSYLSCPSSPNVAFGTGDFTIEYWVYPNDVSGSSQKGMFQTSDTVGGLKTSYTTGMHMNFGYNGSTSVTGAILANVGGTTIASPTAVVTTGAWYHVAVVRSASIVTVYVNGNSVASGTATNNLTGTYLAVGCYYNTSYSLNGYIDDFRITTGFARYRYNFTPPAAPFPNK